MQRERDSNFSVFFNCRSVMDVSKRSCKIILSIVVLLSATNHASAQNYNSDNKLHIDVLYESRCPDSRNFMQYQLKHAYPKIKDRVVLNYVPFGKAYSYDSKDGKKFSCQHGARECSGNVFQACVLNAIGSDQQDVQTSFVVCAMDFSKNPTHCAQNIGVDLNKVNQCASGDRGVELQLQAEKYSLQFIKRSAFVPTIVYNNAYSATEFWESLDDFTGVVEDKLRRI